MITRSKMYARWADMIYRCSRETHLHYVYYGGRGITVCERWLTFSNYLADMGSPLDDVQQWSVDRRDNDGPYSPENCRWATPGQQLQNRRPVKEWPSRITEITPGVHVYRVAPTSHKARIYEPGERYSGLTVTMRRTPPEPRVGCLCECGTYKMVLVANLGRSTTSCGCRNRARVQAQGVAR